MAITVKTQAKRERVGIIQRSKASNHWADAANAAASAAFKEIQWLEVGQYTPDAGVSVDEFNTTSQIGTHREKERRFVDPVSGLVRLPFSGTCDKATLSIFLTAALQAVSEAATTPFAKIFSSAGLTDLPNWADNEGYLFDIALYQGASADDGVLIRRCLIDQLTISVDFMSKGQSRLFKISGTFVGQSILYGQTFTLGNWTNTSAVQNFFNDQEAWSMAYTHGTYGDPYFSVNSVDLKDEYLKSFTLNINNNIQGDNWGTGGAAGQYTWSPTYDSTIILWHNATTEGLIQALKEDHLVQFALTNDPNASEADGDFTITCLNGGVTSGTKVYDNNYLGVQLNVAWYYSSGGGTPIRIFLADAVDYGY